MEAILYPQNDRLGGNFPYTMTYAHGPPLNHSNGKSHPVFCEGNLSWKGIEKFCNKTRRTKRSKILRENDLCDAMGPVRIYGAGQHN